MTTDASSVIVEYDVMFGQKKAATPFKTFLKDVIDDKLTEQSFEYKKAACRVLLRFFSLCHADLNVFYVRRSDFLEPTSEPHKWDVAGMIYLEPPASETNSKNVRPEEATFFKFIQIDAGKISRLQFYAAYGTCGGWWSDCCGSSFVPKNFDAEMLRDLMFIGCWDSLRNMEEIAVSDDTLETLVEINREHPITSLALPDKEFSLKGAEKLKELTKLHSFSFKSDRIEMNEKIFEQLIQLPDLKALTIDSHRLSQKCFDLIGQCKSLKILNIRRLRPIGIHSLKSIENSKQLESITIRGISNVYSRNKEQFELENDRLDIHGFPNLKYFLVDNLKETHLSVRNTPALENLETDACSFDGDVLEGKGPKKFHYLRIPANEITEKQVKNLAGLSVRDFTLHQLKPKSLDVLNALSGGRIGWLELYFSAGASSLYGETTLQLELTRLQTFRVNFEEPSEVTVSTEKMPNLQWLNVSNVRSTIAPKEVRVGKYKAEVW